MEMTFYLIGLFLYLEATIMITSLVVHDLEQFGSSPNSYKTFFKALAWPLVGFVAAFNYFVSGK